jgi:hypothetical protein
MLTIVVAGIHILLSCKCMKHVIMGQLGVAKNFNFMFFPCNKFPYSFFLAFFSILTVLSLTDTQTNGEVLGRIWFTRTCPAAYRSVQSHWEASMVASVLHDLPLMGTPDIANVTLAAYLLQLIPMLFFLWYTIPQRGEHIDYVIGADTMEKKIDLNYHTWHNQNSFANHGAVLQVQASIARFEVVNFQDFEFTLKKMDLFKPGIAERDLDRTNKYLTLVRVQLERGVARFILIGLVQNALQANLQTTFVALNWDATRADYPDGQMLFSVIMCYLNSVLDLPDMISIFLLCRKVLNEVNAEDLDERTMPYPNVADSFRKRQKMPKVLYSELKYKGYRFIGQLIIYTMISFWTMYKLFGMYACPGRLINIPSPEHGFDVCTGGR